tara:strand:+ start:3429 stop:4013 length:585 start_codon:yes stop_codon:yes gene_type:complete
MLYTAIDVGYRNLGLIQVSVNNGEIKPLFMKKIDISRIPHTNVPICKCEIPHTNEVADHISHFIQEYQEVLSSADVILMERQPPGGLTNIEALLFFIFRNKIKLISPNSVHAHFGFGHLDYEQRKERVVSIASKYITLPNIERKHDIADAFCMILYEVQKNQLKFKRVEEIKRLPFDNYRLDAEGSFRETPRSI